MRESKVFPDTPEGNQDRDDWYSEMEAKGYRHLSMQKLPLVRSESGEVNLLQPVRWRCTVEKVVW